MEPGIYVVTRNDMSVEVLISKKGRGWTVSCPLFSIPLQFFGEHGEWEKLPEPDEEKIAYG